MNDNRGLEFYLKFEKAYKLSSGNLDFKFKSSDYWYLANQYIEFMINRTNSDVKPFNSLFAFYYNSLSDDIKAKLI